MGAWLSSLHVRSDDRELVRNAAEAVAATGGCKFFLGPVRRGWITLLADLQSLSDDSVRDFAKKVGAPMFYCLVADDDDFRYQFFRDGALVDRYSSNPEAYADDIPQNERDQWRGVPKHYLDLLGGIGAVEKCLALLRQQHGDDDDSSFVFESERLERFSKLLGFSHAHIAYSDLESDETFPGRRQFKHVPDDSAAKTTARSKSAAIRAEYRRLIKTGIVFADLRPPGGKREARGLRSEWIFDPIDSSMLLWWAKYSPESSGPGTRIPAPAYRDLQPLDMKLPREIRSLRFSPSGRLLAVGTFRGTELWQWPSREVVVRIEHDRMVSWPCFDSAECMLVLAGADQIIVWDIPKRHDFARMRVEEMASSVAVHPAGVITVCGMQNGTILFRERPSLAVSKRFTTYRGILDSGENQIQASMKLWATRPTELGIDEANDWFRRNANPEHFASLLFSPKGEWLFAATDRGMRAWRWDALMGAPSGKAPAPGFACDARPVQSFRGMSSCYALAYDENNERLLFAGMEGLVEYLDLRSGRIGTLLRPPELLAIRKLVLSPDNSCLAIEAHELKMNSSRASELRLWNYPALCAAAGL